MMWDMKHMLAILALLLLSGCSQPPVEAEVSVEGMTCVNCAITVGTFLRSTEGIQDATITFDNRGGTIRADDEESIKRAVERVIKNHPQFILEYTIVEQQPGS